MNTRSAILGVVATLALAALLLAWHFARALRRRLECEGVEISAERP